MRIYGALWPQESGLQQIVGMKLSVLLILSDTALQKNS